MRSYYWAFRKEDIEPPKLVINRVRSHMLHEQDMLDVDEIVRTLSIELLGVVEDDDEVIRATNTGEPVALQPSGKARWLIVILQDAC